MSKLEDFPLGYPRVSYVLDSDDSFMMYRRFGQLHSRVLLHKQDRLREMEEELLALDKRDDRLEDTQLYLQCREEDEMRDEDASAGADGAGGNGSGSGGQRSRTELLAAIETTLLEYGKVLVQAKEMQGLNRPTHRDHASVSNYFRNEQPVVEQERGWVERKEDLVTIRPGREHAWLDAAVESVLRWYPCKPVKVR